MRGRPERRHAARVFACTLTAVVLSGCSEADRAHDFGSLTGPGGAVLTTTVVEPWFPQGPHQVVVYVQTQPESPRVEVARTTLAYDGVPFTRSNINMSWTGANEAIVCLRATDRPDRSVRVSVHHESPRGELHDGC